MKKNLMIPAGKLAGDLSEAEREELKKKLLYGLKPCTQPILPLKNEDCGIVPPGYLACDLSEEELSRKRDELKKRLREAKEESISTTSEQLVSTEEFKEVLQGKRKVQQWYEKSPELLKSEKAAMHQFFPNFTLDRLADGRLCWIGSLNVGILGDNQWKIMAVYQNNHPQKVMGSTVRVYLVDPNINQVIEGLNWRPHKLLRDEEGNLYLCTAMAEDVRVGPNVVTSAASIIGYAVKWLMALELLLTGDISKEQFNTHGII